MKNRHNIKPRFSFLAALKHSLLDAFSHFAGHFKISFWSKLCCLHTDWSFGSFRPAREIHLGAQTPLQRCQ
ncbi:MAG: hypothetical protein ACI3ZK_00120, partial [Candidatus Cryptobacteroides sp.]